MRRVIDWLEYESLAVKVRKSVIEYEPDLVVGIARGGLPLAVHLSNSLPCPRFGMVYMKKTRSDRAFDLDEEVTSIGNVLPPEQVHSVLLVDDIVALGDVFSEASGLLRDRYGPDCTIRYASLFADVSQIEGGPWSAVLEQLDWAENIDNRVTWIEFPWESLSS